MSIRRLFTALALLTLLPVSAWAQCAGGLLSNCQPAANLQSSDVVYGWQFGQVPHSRSMTVGQLGIAALGSTLSSPPPIGNVTPGTGAFSSLTANATTIFNPATGAGSLTLGAGGASNHLVFSAPLVGTAPSITATGTNGFNIGAGTGTVNIQSPFSINPGTTITWAGSAQTPAISSVQVHNGASTTNPSLNSLTITDSVGTAAVGQVRGLTIFHNYGGGTTAGGRATFNVATVQQNGANADSANNYYEAGVFQVFARYPQPGSSPTNPLGRAVGMNITAALQDGFAATNYKGVNAAELSAGMSAGSTAAERSVLNLNDLVGTSQGFNIDNMIWFYGAGAPWRYGMNFGDGQPWPIDATNGTVLGAKIGSAGYNSRPFQAKWGTDLHQVIFPATGNPYDGGFFRTNGASMDGNGTLQLGTTYFTSSAAGLSVDAKGSIGNGVSISTPGTGYATNAGAGVTDGEAVTALGGVWLVTTNASGVPISVRALTQPQWPLTTGAPATVTPTNLNRASLGTGLILALTWNTTATTLALQPSGGATTFGAGTQNILTITPGATTATAATIGSNTGGVRFSGSGPTTMAFATIGNGGTYTWSGTTLDTTKFPFNVANNCAGTTTFGEIPCSGRFVASSMNVNAPGTLVDVVSITGITGGASARSAGWQALSLVLNDGSPTNDFGSAQGAQFPTLQIARRASVNQGGTSFTAGGAQGFSWGIDIVNSALAGATFQYGQNGVEINQAVTTGASVVRRAGLQISQPASHVLRGLWDNAIYVATGGATYINGLAFGGNLSAVSTFGSDSKIITNQTSANGVLAVADRGLDFNEVGFTSCSICAPGFWVDPAGAANIGTAFLTPTSAGLEIDAKGSVGTGVPTVNAGGSGLITGSFIADDIYGGVYLIATAAGVATFVTTVIHQPRFPTTSPPATRALTARPPEIGTGVVLNGTWDSTRTALSIQPTGGPVVMAGLPTSAPATHCALWVNTGVVTRTTCP